jgi:hypothetical protein
MLTVASFKRETDFEVYYGWIQPCSFRILAFRAEYIDLLTGLFMVLAYIASHRYMFTTNSVSYI